MNDEEMTDKWINPKSCWWGAFLSVSRSTTCVAIFIASHKCPLPPPPSTFHMNPHKTTSPSYLHMLAGGSTLDALVCVGNKQLPTDYCPRAMGKGCLITSWRMLDSKQADKFWA
jgi:hypothetical protein